MIRMNAAEAAAAVVGTVIAAILIGWASTWRKDTSELEKLDHRLKQGERLVAAFWHGKYFSLLPLANGLPATVVTVDSFRGKVIARICRCFGYRAVQVSRSAGTPALAHVEDELSDGAVLAAAAVDGPLGPRHQPKAGAIRICADLGYRLVPVSVNGAPKIVSAKRWDRHEIPLPFARVRIAVGEPIDVPRDLAAEDMAKWQALLRDRLQAIDPQVRQD
jgi:lysophospholipid acyltransferase (LPLAT)-like uncharacterized protein